MRENVSPSLPGKGGVGRVRVEWTARGFVFVGLGVGLFVVGMLRVDGVMAAMGLSAGILLVWVRWLGRRNVAGLELGYRGLRRVQAGKGFDAKVELWNRRGLLDGFRVEFGIRLMGERDVVGSVGWIPAGGVATAVERVRLKDRGLRKEQEGWVRSSFPLGLLGFRRELGVKSEVGVLPANRVPNELRVSGFLLDGMPFGGTRQYGGMGEWKGLREWRVGDGVKKVAWAASMRSGQADGRLVVREYEPPGSQVDVCVVVFHSLGGDKKMIRPDRFERALSLLSGVLGYLQGMGVEVRFVADFREWESVEVVNRRQVARVREELMLAKRAGWTEAHDLRGVLGGVGDGECLVVISDMPAETWRAHVPRMVLEPVIVDVVKHEAVRARSFRYERGGVK